MTAAQRLREPDTSTRAAALAVMVTRDDVCGLRTCRSLRARGYLPIVLPSIDSARAALTSIAADVVLLDARRELAELTRLLVDLSRLHAAPTTVLVTDHGSDITWVGARSGLLAGAADDDADLDHAVERSLREARRPRSPR
jgi:hypothetical protein